MCVLGLPALQSENSLTLNLLFSQYWSQLFKKSCFIYSVLNPPNRPSRSATSVWWSERCKYRCSHAACLRQGLPRQSGPVWRVSQSAVWEDPSGEPNQGILNGALEPGLLKTLSIPGAFAQGSRSALTGPNADIWINRWGRHDTDSVVSNTLIHNH